MVFPQALHLLKDCWRVGQVTANWQEMATTILELNAGDGMVGPYTMMMMSVENVSEPMTLH